MKVAVTDDEKALLKHVQIDMAPVLYDNHVPVWESADTVYKQGYWATELFGTHVYLVAYRSRTNYIWFNFSVRQIKTDLPFKTADELIRTINNRQYNLYKHYLLGGNYED